MTYTIAILYLCVVRILLFSCRVVYKNPAMQQAFSGLSLYLIKNEKMEESENTKKHYLQLLRQRIKPEKYYLVFISSRQHWM